MAVFLLLSTWLVAVGQYDDPVGAISGTAVNGSAGEVAMAGTEVVLRASQDGAFVPVAVTTTDNEGRFSFHDLPVDRDLIYLAGVNHLGIHYPGPRVNLSADRATANVRLIAFETAASPSPLVSRRHEIGVVSGEGFLEVSETILVDNPSRATFVGQAAGDNPSRATFVGQAAGDRPPVTLQLSLPEGIEKVTFEREFHGRNFRLHEGRLVTELPWPPGSRELKFNYRVPVERRFGVLNRVLDLPTTQVVVQVTTKSPDEVACNLPRATTHSDGQVVFEQRGKTLQAGHEIVLELGTVPVRLETYARWLAVSALVALLAGAVLVARGQWQNRPVEPESALPAANHPSSSARRRMRKPSRSTASLPR